MRTETLYQDFKARMAKQADVSYTIGVLSWDKEVNMPSKGERFRNQQIATLSGIAHEMFTSDAIGELLEQLDAKKEELSFEEARNIELTKRDFHRSKKLNEAFVIRRSQFCSQAYDSWLKAKAANDFSKFQAAFEEIIKIKQEEAALLGYEASSYNALLEDYEPGYTAAMLDELFADVRAKLVDFVREIRQQPQVDDSFLYQRYTKKKQWDFSIYLLKQLGYSFEAGRQDWSPHPFTINFSANDVRITTRVNERDLATLLWSSIHECGHALYEQGLPTDYYGLPVGYHVSLGIHESQSRLWENNVGRSLAFWKGQYPQLQNTFSKQLSKVNVAQFYKGINKIEPSLIRTEADELHYHFHIMTRYELEKAMLEGDLRVKDVESAWNEKYKSYLDLDVPDAKSGVLQDIHWAYGSIGYFPTYSLGSFYAAQLFSQAEKDMPTLREEMEQGKTDSVLAWLRTNIHQQGRRYTATELCTKVTGEPLNFKYFYDYAKAKYSHIYGLT